MLRDHPSLGRWLRQTPKGRLAIDRVKVKAEERLDGKYLLATSDPDLTAEDAALATRTCWKPNAASARGSPSASRSSLRPQERGQMGATTPLGDLYAMIRNRKPYRPTTPRTPPAARPKLLNSTMAEPALVAGQRPPLRGQGLGVARFVVAPESVSGHAEVRTCAFSPLGEVECNPVARRGWLDVEQRP